MFGGDIPALPVLAAVPTPPLGPVWVALLIVAAASAVVVGQQCARRPLPLLPALGKLIIASAVAAATMALLGYAGGGQLGNFGHVGVDQTTFGPAVFLWFVGIGGLTVAMAGGIARRSKVAAPLKKSVEPVEPEPSPEPEPEPEDAEPGLEPDLESEEELAPDDEAAPVEQAAPAEAELPDLDDLPDPEDLAYFDEDDATPGPIGDQTRRADD